jgi:hypothetical protein
VTFTPRAAVLWGLGSYDDPDLTFQGIDDFGVEWVLGMPDGWKRTSAETPVLEGGGDGGWAGTVRRRVKPLTLRGAFRSCRADADLQAAEDRLRAALENYTTTDTLLWRGGAQPVQMGIKLSGDLDVDEYRNRQVRTFTAVVTADDPYKYAAGAAGLLAVSIAAPTTTRAGVTFPVDFSHGGVVHDADRHAGHADSAARRAGAERGTGPPALRERQGGLRQPGPDGAAERRLGLRPADPGQRVLPAADRGERSVLLGQGLQLGGHGDRGLPTPMELSSR